MGEFVTRCFARDTNACHRTSVSGRIVVMASTIDGNHRYNCRKNRRSLFANWTPTTHLALKDNHLTSQPQVG
jgi:hypothetical protein